MSPVWLLADETSTTPKIETTAAPKVTVEVVAAKLDHPSGVAVQPDSSDVLVSNTGAGEVVRFAGGKADAPSTVIAGFAHSTSEPNDNPIAGVGPLGLVFLDPNILAVGAGEAKNGDQYIRIFELPKAAADAKPIDLGGAKSKLGPTTVTGTTLAGAGNFYSLAVSEFAPPTLYATNRGPNERGWVFKSDIRNRTAPSPLTPNINTKIENHTAAPSAVAVSPRGLLVVGNMGTLDQPHDSWLSFYNTKTEPVTLMAHYPTSLHDIVGLAYSPKSGALYAIDFAAAHPADGGVYRLDAATIDRRSGVKAVKIAAIDRPTALAFSPDNTLYVTSFGVAAESKSSDTKSTSETKSTDETKPASEGTPVQTGGQLVKITGDL
ncbi:MAG TPA: hypothetical protein VGJ15_13775 [Pirellulales bacterium]